MDPATGKCPSEPELKVRHPSRLLKFAQVECEARRKSAKIRSLCLINEHLSHSPTILAHHARNDDLNPTDS